MKKPCVFFSKLYPFNSAPFASIIISIGGVRKLTFHLKFNSAKDKSLNYSRVSKSKRTNLVFEIFVAKLEDTSKVALEVDVH
jgi:hypothetical protein